jgi:hypothetical protein
MTDSTKKELKKISNSDLNKIGLPLVQSDSDYLEEFSTALE